MTDDEQEHTTLAPEARTEADGLFVRRFREGAAQIDKMFAKLMLLQWVAAMGFAVWVSPYAWAGKQQVVHAHVFAAIFIGGAITSMPVLLAFVRPSERSTRYVVACSQMLWSALLIHLTGGRIETHFHVFGSLAFVAFYRDLRVLIPATIIVAADHFIRGIYWPESVYGIANPEWWRFLEHAGWVAFIDVVLVLNCVRSCKELRETCEQQALLNQVHLERITEAKRAAAECARAEAHAERSRELATMQTRLVEASRRAGMAEIATNVLHNVGNVLTSVNVSAWMLREGLQDSRADRITKIAELVTAHADDLPRFFSDDPRGVHIPELLSKLGTQLEQERASQLEDVDQITACVEHIKRVIHSQMGNARASAVTEVISPADIAEEACSIESFVLANENIELIKKLEAIDAVPLERHRVMEILINFLSNARHALRDTADKRIVVEVGCVDERVVMTVTDNGAGIAPENIDRVFEHGFTTKLNGHGFGLHASANSAAAIGGKLSAHSDGLATGARFELTFPLHHDAELAA